jgi:hypothetical protein
MLTMRKAQMDILRRDASKRFAEHLARRFAALWPERASRLAEAHRLFVDASIQRAMSYGIESQSAIARFVNLSHIWGHDFENRPEHAWALKILTNPNLKGQRKMDDLVFRTRLKLEVLEANRGERP